MIIGLVHVFLPFMIVPLYASLEKLDAGVEEAAQDLGAGRLQTFLRITLPLTMPGVAMGSLLVFILSLGSFLDAGSAGRHQQPDGLEHHPGRVSGKRQLAVRRCDVDCFSGGLGGLHAGLQSPVPVRGLRPMKDMPQRLLTVAVYVFLFLPIVMVVVMSFNASRYSVFPAPGWTTEWYRKAFEDERIVEALRTSGLVALVSAAFATAIGTCTSIALVRFRFRFRNAVRATFMAPLVFPEMILAVTLLILSPHPPR